VDEVRIRLKRDASESPVASSACVRLERARIGGRLRHVLVLPDRAAEALQLSEGDQFLIEGLEEIPWTVEFKYAVDAVARSLDLTRYEFASAHPIGLLNTPEGEREFWRTRTEVPDLPIPRCRHGIVVNSGRMHFAYLNPDIWESGKDIVPTSIHLILHILHPQESEEGVMDRERAIREFAELRDGPAQDDRSR